MRNLKDRIVEIASTVLEVEPEWLTDERAMDDLGVSSIVWIDFIVMLERQFDIDLPHATVAAAKNFGEVVSVVEIALQEHAA